VRVVAGRDAGKSGRVLSVTQKNTVVVGISHHETPHPSQPGQEHKGGIVEKEAGINVSNVMVVCSNAASTRALARILPDGTKVPHVQAAQHFG